MVRRKKELPAGVKVAFEAITGRPRGRGIFGIEEEGDEVARQAKLQRMAERIAEYERGYGGNRRRCPQWERWPQYKGEASREGEGEGGRLTVVRAYYVCPRCPTASYPLAEQLGLGPEREQGVAGEAGGGGGVGRVSSSPAGLSDAVGEGTVCQQFAARGVTGSGASGAQRTSAYFTGAQTGSH